MTLETSQEDARLRRAALGLSWLAIMRLGLVQTALGSVVVLCTAAINRVMIVELALAASIPAALLGLYHAFQMLRPRWGHASDARAGRGRRRTPLVLGGMAALGLGAVGAATATAWMETSFTGGLLLAIGAFALIGLGLGAAATNLLAMLAAHVAPERKAAAGGLVWILMIAGLAISGVTIGQFLDPYSGGRLVVISIVVAAIAFSVSALALWGVEPRRALTQGGSAPTDFRAAALQVWRDPTARRFTIFVFVAMLAYNTQDLILEPFGGHVFGMTPGESTALGGKLHAGALLGMIVVFVLGLARAAGGWGRPALLSLIPSTATLVTAGCIGSGAALLALGLGGLASESWPLAANVMALGFANGVFAVAAIGAMMGLASRDASGRRENGKEGVRMGVFGAAQSIGFAVGAGLGALMLDALRATLGLLAESYAVIFMAEGALFLIAAALARQAIGEAEQRASTALTHVEPSLAATPGE